MNKEELAAYLETDEGKLFLEEQKKPLLAKRDELMSEVKTAKDKLKAVEELGDLDTLKSILSKHKENEDKIKQAEAEALAKSGNFKALEENLRAELTKKEESVNKFRQKAIQSKIESDLTAAIVENKGVPELLKPLLTSRIKGSLTEDGDVEVEVLDDNGQPLFVGGKAGTIKDLIESIKSNEVYGRAFEATGASGSGTRNSTTKGTGGVILDTNDPNYSVSAAMAYYAKHPHLSPYKKK